MFIAVAIIIVVTSEITLGQIHPYLGQILGATGDIAYNFASIIFAHAKV